MDMDVKRYMKKEELPFKESALARLDRIYSLVDGLDKLKATVEAIPEQNSSEGLKAAYKALAKAFTDVIKEEQAGLTEEVER